MFRFHDFTHTNTLDFWRTYYKDPTLLKVLSYANSVMGAKAGGYELLQDYDIMNVGAHLPGTVVTWEPLIMSSYRYSKDANYPHAYFISTNVLDIQTLNDKLSDPTVSLQNEVDFMYNEEYRGILRLLKDFPTEPIIVESGIIDGTPVYSEEGRSVALEISGFDPIKEYAYEYTITGEYQVNSLEALSARRGTIKERRYALTDDYLFDPVARKLYFKLKLPTVPMFITKGTISETRLTDEVGRIVGYSRFDSREYRDSIETVSTALMDVPSIRNIKASISTAFRLASSKYGDEEVTSLRNGNLTTDKYVYPLRKSDTDLQLGDTIKYNEPVTNAMELYTHRTHPNWWVDRLPELFQKYAEDVLTPSRKNRMMSVFLKGHLAHARLDIRKVDTINLAYQDDVREVTMDSLPIRSDLIVTNYFYTEDLNMPEMDYEQVRLRHCMSTIWYGYTPPVDCPEFYDARRRVIHVFLAPHEQKDWSWLQDVRRYHIVGPNSEFNQYWSTERFVHPYLEPCLERWWWRAVTVSDIPLKQVIYDDMHMELPNELGAIPAVLGSGAGGDYINQIQNTFTREETSFKGISGFTTLDYSDFPGWTFNGLWLGVLGIVSPIGGSGYGTSGPQDMGIIPKKIRITLEADTPFGTGYTIQWSTDGNNFVDYAEGTWVGNIRGNLYIRIHMHANSYNYPILTEVNLEVKVN